ncbi:MAG: hypothetical protein RLZZ316_147 [Bacteroidota bacterium]
MSTAIKLFIAITFLITSCKKDNAKVSPQTVLLLQNKWTLTSSNLVFPTNTSLNSTYKGIAADYYQFGVNDSLTIQQAGQVNLSTMPLFITTKYSFIDNSRLVYSLSPGIEINIKVLTNNLLVLTNAATSTVTNNGVVVATYNGTKTDSLRR